MRTFLQVVFLTLFAISLFAQSIVSNPRAARLPSHAERSSKFVDVDRSIPTEPLSPLVTVSGATNTGITGKWYLQTQGQALHNVQVDPSNPNNIHVCAMMAFDVVADDTLEASYYLNRRVYYVFSSDGGSSWTTPKAISGLRTGYPAMVLLKRNNLYVPVIAAHRNVSESETDVMTCLFMETGNPGDGNFVTIEGSRVTYLDGLRDVIWPSVAISKDGTKAFVVAAAFNTPVDYLQFGWFAFTEDKMSATFSGWKPGPAANDQRALTSGGNYCIRVAESGKVGVVWQNYDYSIPDLGLYYCESTDEGTTWSTPNNIFYAHGSSNDGFSLIPASGLDLLFDGDEPVVSFTGYLSDMLESGGSYIPAAGALMFWRQGYTDAKLLAFRVGDGTTIEGLEPIYDATWLAGWLNTDPVDPGGANLEHATMGIGSDPKKITIFFEAWVQDDVGEIGEFPGNPARSAAPFHSIWKMTTLDGGATWREPVAVYANDLSGTERVDYRNPGVSTFNPTESGGTNFHLSFTADDAPGDNNANGENNFSDVSVFFAKNFTAKAKKASTPEFSIEQNYPNPVVNGSKSIIPVSLANAEYVTVSITDIMGREVATVFARQLDAGNHEVPFSTQALAAGMYQYIVKMGDVTLARSFTVVQ